MKSEMQERLAHALDIPEQELKTDDENNNCSKCSNLDRLVDLIQAKVAVSSQKEKIKLLTLAPESWSIQKVISKFNVTEYIVKKARALKKEHVILAEPKPKSGRALSKDVVDDCVKNFYCDDQYSRMCAGKKECLTVKVDGQKEKFQKCLLVLNVREIFLEFKKVNPFMHRFVSQNFVNSDQNMF